MRIAEQMVPELTCEMAATRKLLVLVPDDKLEWSPGSGPHTIGWNASHLVEIVGWVPGILQESEFDIVSAGRETPAPEAKPNVAGLLQQFDAHARAALAALEGVSDAVMAEPWSLKAGGQVYFTMPKGECLRKWVFSHNAHHRAILSTYLRLAGVPHGSVYEADWTA